MPRWDDFTSCTLGYRDVYNGQGMFTERKRNAKKVIWEQKVERFSSLPVRKWGKSSRCWPKSFLISCTADTGSVLRGSMCGSVWIRARTTWKEKSRSTSSRAMYDQSFLLPDNWANLAYPSPLNYLYLHVHVSVLVCAFKWVQLSLPVGNKPVVSAGKRLTSGKGVKGVHVVTSGPMARKRTRENT